jgi:hypothetical protein
MELSELPAILALDPGGTTGWCSYDSSTGLQRGHIDDGNHYFKLFNIIIGIIDTRISRKIHIVCERFEFRKSDADRDKIDYISAEYIGVVKLIGQMYKANSNVKLVMQSASQVKGRKDANDDPTVFFNDDRLKKLGLWLPNMRHAMDATKHYAYYRTFTLNDKTYFHQLREA